jgi:hypothetical protein
VSAKLLKSLTVYWSIAEESDVVQEKIGKGRWDFVAMVPTAGSALDWHAKSGVLKIFLIVDRDRWWGVSQSLRPPGKSFQNL